MLNKVTLIGNLGRDAELRSTPSGQSVANFSLATTERWTDKQGQRQEQTEWHRCILWGKTADSLQQYLVKGKQVYIEGKLQTRQWEKDGQKHYSTEINVREVKLLGGSPNARGRDEDESMDSRPQQPSGGPYGGPSNTIPDDDIPF